MSNASQLSSFHKEQLLAGGLSTESIAAAGIYTEDDQLKVRVLLSQSRFDRKQLPVLVFPGHRIDGSEGPPQVRLNLENIQLKPGQKKPPKYISPNGSTPEPYFPQILNWLAIADDPSQPIAITEGVKKAIVSTQAGIPTIALAGVSCYTLPGRAKLHPAFDRIKLASRVVYIAYDNDAKTKPQVMREIVKLAELLRLHGATVRVIEIPQRDDGEKVGADDFIVEHGPDAWMKLLTQAVDPPPITIDDLKENASKLDPAIEARTILEAETRDGVYRLRYWRGEFYFWRNGCFQSVPTGEIKARLVRALNERWTGLGVGKVADVKMQLEAQGMLPGSINSPSWIIESGDWKAPDWDLQQTLVCSNLLVNLPRLTAGASDAIIPNTPRLFTTSASGVQYNPQARSPERWLQFLHSELWPGDPVAVELLQEWFGLCLVSDMSKQKMLMLIGPKRSGKSKIATMLSLLVGEANVCSPSLSSLGTPFGLWPFAGKTLAVIGDARIGSRADHQMIAESLLKISGQDAVDVHRKNLESLRNVKLQTRIIVISNELPRFLDQSGALASRMMPLKLTESFYGREDETLEATLRSELEGILAWSIEGWKRLNDRGRFVEPESGKELAAQLEEIASPIGSFVEQHCTIDPDRETDLPEIYSAYQEWCAATGREPANESVFGRDLQARFTGIHKKQRGKPSRVRFYKGIGLA